MHHKIQTAIICLRISQVVYLLLGMGVPLLSSQSGEPVAFVVFISVMTGVCLLAMIVGLEILINGLKKRRKWSWITGLIVFGLYAPSLFLPLGVMGLWAMLNAGTQQELGVTNQRAPA